MKKILVLFLFVSFLSIEISPLTGQQLFQYRQSPVDNLIYLCQFDNDTLYGSPQSFSWVSIPMNRVGESYKIDLAWDDTLLIPTSEFGSTHAALIALNGGFFNTIKGGSVTYIESEGALVSKRSYDPEKRRDPDPFNGAVILTCNGGIRIEPRMSDSSYLASGQEQSVLITGPLLISNNQPYDLPETSFSKDRHPRSAIGLTEKDLILIAVDGRAKEATGMSLKELQEVLIQLGCKYAINLDGGGSTTLWINTDAIRGIINHPSDNKRFDHKGERKVANAIIISRMK